MKIVLPVAAVLLALSWLWWPEDEPEPGLPAPPAPTRPALPPPRAERVHRDPPAPPVETPRRIDVTEATEDQADARARAYEERLAPGEPPPAGVVEQGLREADARVRLRVLSRALLYPEGVSPATLQELALGDPDPVVRQTALAAVALHPAIDATAAERVAQLATSDPDVAVSSAAVEVLDGLDPVQPEPLAAEAVGEAAAVPLDPDADVQSPQ